MTKKRSFFLTGSLSLLVCLALSPLFLTPVLATEYTVTATPASGTLSGSGAGNVKNFTAVIDLGNFVAEAEITDAECSITQATSAMAGSFSVSDKFSKASLFTSDLQATAKTYTFDCTEQAKTWLQDSSKNTGLLVEGSGFASDESVVLNSIKAVIQYAIPDKTGPALLQDPVAGKISDTSYRITVATDEAATSVIEYGKTSNYSSSLTQSESNTAITFDLTGLMEGVTYHYHLKLTDASGNTTISPDYTFTVDLANITVAPTRTALSLDTSYTVDLDLTQIKKLVAQLTEQSGNYAVKLSWDGISGVDGYRIYRKEVTNDGEKYEDLKKLDNTVLTYTDTDVKQGVEYQYQIRTLNGDKQSQATESDKISVPKAANGTLGNILQTTSTNTWFLIGLGVAAVLFAIYYLIKACSKIKQLFQTKSGKGPLKNVFRDPDMNN